jgi:hypothetical protein
LLQHDLRQSYFCNPGVIKKDFRTFGFDMRNQTTDEQREVDEERRGADGEKTINLSEHVRIEATVRVGTNSFSGGCGSNTGNQRDIHIPECNPTPPLTDVLNKFDLRSIIMTAIEQTSKSFVIAGR